MQISTVCSLLAVPLLGCLLVPPWTLLSSLVPSLTCLLWGFLSVLAARLYLSDPSTIRPLIPGRSRTLENGFVDRAALIRVGNCRPLYKYTTAEQISAELGKVK